MKKRPSFKKQKHAQAYENPEELFGKLPNRAESHGYLRAPQVDAMRSYEKLKPTDDVALELPTGTGKTTVGLVIAEWNRRKYGKKVAYLSLTNQLAKQVLDESEKLGIGCADLIGNKLTRDQAEVGRYQSGQAIAVSTYSNLFNVNPIIKETDVLIFDDAHGGEGYVSSMWTVSINVQENMDIYKEALTILRPVLSDAQYRVVTDKSQYRTVVLADIHFHPESVQLLTNLLDEIEDNSILFPWKQIRNNLDSCLFFVSLTAIVIRPIVPPTHTHASFDNCRQRIFMSATLGGAGDLIRAYGTTNINSVHAQNPQWGYRYIFAPGLYLNESEVGELVSKLWGRLENRRVLLLAPSFSIEQQFRSKVLQNLKPEPIVLSAHDIEGSLDPFTTAGNVVLSLAGRYDGLDLPGDDCRLLLLAETPSAVGSLEQHQKDHWKLGPLLRRRERTRIIQGMGRCTRDATDFAVILLLGQSLIDSLTNSNVVGGFPGEIQRELKWGIEQSQSAVEDPEKLEDMIIGILDDSEYRKDANEALEDMIVPEIEHEPESFEQLAKNEVKYSRALWSGNFSTALETAHQSADGITDKQLAGYRAWWLFLAAHAAHLKKESDVEIDFLRRSRAVGINAGFLDVMLRKRASDIPDNTNDSLSDSQVEAIWNVLDNYGWHGPKFGSCLSEMQAKLALLTEPEKYHIGLETLGKLLGAETIRSKDKGAPDVVWIFSGQSFTFEVKSDKSPNTSINKKEIQQAVGHPNWLKSNRPEMGNMAIQAVIISPNCGLTQEAKPHVDSLNYISTDDVASLAEQISKELQKLRTDFAGKEYAEVVNMFKVQLELSNLSLETIRKDLGNAISTD